MKYKHRKMNKKLKQLKQIMRKNIYEKKIIKIENM